MIEARADTAAGDGDAHWGDEGADFRAGLRGGGFENGLDAVRVERAECRQSGAQFFHAGFVFRDELLFGRFGIRGIIVAEVELRSQRRVDELLLFLAICGECASDVFLGERAGFDARLVEFAQAEGVPFGCGGGLQILGVHPLHLHHVESGVAAQDAGQIEALNDLLEGDDLAVIFRGPAEEAEVIHHGFRQEETVHVGVHGSADIALAHLGAIRVQDERDVRVFRSFCTEGAEEGDVLGGVAEVIFTTDDVRDVHQQVIDDVH